MVALNLTHSQVFIPAPSGANEEFAILAPRYDFRPEYPPGMVDHINAHITEIPTDCPAVDVGAGTGLFTRPLARGLTPKRPVVAIEPSDPMRRQGERRSQKGDGVSYISGFAESLSFRDRTVALVAAACAAHRFQRLQFFREVHRVLHPGGLISLVEYRLDDSSNGIADQVYDLLEDLAPNFQRAAHTNASGVYEVVDFAAELRASNKFGSIHDRLWRWSVKFDSDHFYGMIASLTPAMRAEQIVGKRNLSRRIEHIFASFCDDHGYVMVPYVAFGTFARRLE